MKAVTFDAENIYIHGKPEVIMSGAMHYFRIPKPYWRDRLLKLKELGCNCVETYVCWNLHEKREGEFDFSGWLDLGEYLRLAQEMGLYAIVRPGPYICSEWDFGGLPWWLLKEKSIELRTSQPLYLQKITPYLEKVCEILREHQISRGGNVIFVQLENEYGSHGTDKDYLRWLKKFYEEHGIDCQLITSDGDTETHLHEGTLPDVMASVNYRWDSEKALAVLQKYHGNQPGAVMELWNGRARFCGYPYEPRDLDEVVRSVDTALDHAKLINLYMFHGGTTFGFQNGSMDIDARGRFVIHPTSYNVDAPVNEYGVRTPKYYAEQAVICKKLGKPIENTATDPVFRSYDLTFCGETSLQENPTLLRKTTSPTLPTMEDCDQGYGYIVYQTEIFVGGKETVLHLPDVHDIAHVYVDGTYVKTFFRNETPYDVKLEHAGTATVQILVENMGRVNFGDVSLADRKGLVGRMTVTRKEGYDIRSFVNGFTVWSLELKTLPAEFTGKAVEHAPAFYCYEFDVEECADTILRLQGFTRGAAFLNGFHLGRHWDIEGTENKLFLPAPLLKQGKNQLVIFDILANKNKKTVVLTDR